MGRLMLANVPRIEEEAYFSSYSNSPEKGTEVYSVL